jgi:hypothetical protein
MGSAGLFCLLQKVGQGVVALSLKETCVDIDGAGWYGQVACRCEVYSSSPPHYPGGGNAVVASTPVPASTVVAEERMFQRRWVPLQHPVIPMAEAAAATHQAAKCQLLSMTRVTAAQPVALRPLVSALLEQVDRHHYY